MRVRLFSYCRLHRDNYIQLKTRVTLFNLLKDNIRLLSMYIYVLYYVYVISRDLF